jgi:hypothetical protein
MFNHEGEWSHFKRKVVPSDAPTIQVHETKLAFLAGLMQGYTNSYKTMTGPDTKEIAVARIEYEIESIRQTLRKMGMPL